MKSYFQRKCRESRDNVFATFKEKVTGNKFRENSRIKMSREFKVANCWKGRKICRKMYLIEQKSCKLLQQIEKKKMRTNVGDGKRKLGVLLHFIVKNKRKKCFSKKLKVIRRLNVAINEITNCPRKKNFNFHEISFLRFFFL